MNSTINVKLPHFVKTLSAALFAVIPPTVTLMKISLVVEELHCETTMLSSDKGTGGYADQTEYVPMMILRIIQKDSLMRGLAKKSAIMS